jgi:pimeloyl-ACP methyl ester carboxylesterase
MAERRGSTETYNYPRTTRVSHLGGIEASYRMAGAYKQYKPTLILINSFTTSSELYASQFANEELTNAMNLIAIEPLGHGGSKLRSQSAETFTYWDTAYMVLQVMDSIGVKKAFALGTSQGGWIVARLALLAPDRVRNALRTRICIM